MRPPHNRRKARSERAAKRRHADLLAWQGGTHPNQDDFAGVDKDTCARKAQIAERDLKALEAKGIRL